MSPRTIGRRTGLAAIGSSFAATACADLLGGLAPPYRTTQAGSHSLAWMTAAWAFTSADLNNAQWAATMKKMRVEGLPFLEAMRGRGHRLTLAAVPLPAVEGIVSYQVDATVAPADGEEHRLPGKPGTDPAAYDAALEPAAKALGLSEPLVQDGHFAIFGLVNMMTALNVANHIIESRLFALLVLEEKIERGETQVDPTDPNRPAAETREDIAAALKVVAAEHRRLATARAEVLTLTTQVARFDGEEVLEGLRETLLAAQHRAEAWRRDNERPTMEDFGVRVATLPSPDDVLDHLRKRAGFLGSIAKVAQGVVTGSPSATLEGLSELAPEDSTAQTALEGLAAAAGGDVEGALQAVVDLAGAEVDIAAYRERFEDLRALGTKAGLP